MISVSPGIHTEPFRGESIVGNEQYADVSEMYMESSPAKGSEF
jgi:hypothetical protein